MTTKKNENKTKEFWGLLRKFSNKKTEAIHLSHQNLSDHFKSTLNTNTDVHLPPDSTEEGPLDYYVTLEELEYASDILKPGKAFGYDNISNEMIACLVKTYPEVVLKLFNSLLKSSAIIPEWVVGIIVPIHKKGPKGEPSNYRGISLTSCFGKLFLSILNNRLMTFTMKRNFLSQSQLGFLPGNRTADAHIILHNLIRKYCHKNNSKIYSCFVDFSKAFDTIPRDILLRKLLSIGINGNFFNIIKNIYNNDKACVKLNNQYTETFGINQGVRQGCVLSPLLFNIFLADLPKKLESISGKVKIDTLEINSLIWADDLVLLSENENNLTQLLETLDAYCKDNKLTINIEKSKCMIFNKTGRLIRRNFFINGNKLENIRNYKYLGFLFTPSGEIRSGLQDLRDRSFKAFMKLRSQLGTSFNQNVQLSLSLVDSLIKPIMLYASDFWGCLKPPKNNPLEKLNIMICKQILGVQSKTTNIGVLLELGRVPLQLYAIKYSIKNWERIKNKGANKLLSSSYNDAMKENLVWILSIKEYMECNGMLNLYLSDYKNKPPFINKKIFRTLADEFHQEAFESIHRENSKLRTYARYKTEIGYENYLTLLKNTNIRRQFTKYRLSNHNLMIEVGRHQKLAKTHRFCPFCPGIVEDEKHFLISCHQYWGHRTLLFNICKNIRQTFSYYSEEEKLLFIMTCDDVITDVAKFVAHAMEIRNIDVSP